MNDAQLRCLTKGMIFAGRAYKRGEVFWCSAAHAHQLIAAGLAEVVGVRTPAGPSEVKPVEPSEKNSSAAGRTGRSTASPRSSTPGPAAPSSASPADPASTPRKSRARKLLDGMVEKGKKLFE